MKPLLRLLSVLLLAAPLVRAAGPAVPATPFLLSEKRPDGKPNVTYYYFIHRGNGLITPIFSSREAAERFRASFPTEEAARLSPVTFTRAIIEGMVKRGTAVLLDPASPTLGGTMLSSDEAPLGDELKQLFEADQADRNPSAGHAIDGKAVTPRDEQRRERVLALYRDGALKTGADFFYAATILQHATDADELLLAHECCVAALVRGEGRARSLAAVTEDRFLKAIGRPQRFGTQADAGQLYRTDDGVTDALRQVLGVPTLAEARAHPGAKSQP